MTTGIKCACGCGKSVPPVRIRRIYVSREHMLRAWRRKPKTRQYQQDYYHRVTKQKRQAAQAKTQEKRWPQKTP